MSHLRLKFMVQVGACFPGDVRMVLRPFADQYLRAGQAVIVRTPEEIARERIRKGLVPIKRNIGRAKALSQRDHRPLQDKHKR
jgi:hypothetical protein